jgi:PPM family protein phosphatase
MRMRMKFIRKKSFSLNWSGCSDIGKVRKNNEDAFLGLQFDAREIFRLGKFGAASLEKHDFTFAVCDGMGGARAGEFASQSAVEKITTLLPRAFQQSAGGMNAGFSDVLPELFAQIHRALVYLGNSYEECSGMQTTLSLCWFTPEWMYFGHVGDSRIYHLPKRGKKIKQLTHDDTHVGWLFRNGQINEREARTHPRRNVLQKALGGGNQFVDPQVGAVACERGDIFLICSDGLTEGLYDQQLVELLRLPATKAGLNPAQRLVGVAVENHGRDNTTALVIQVGDGGLPAKLSRRVA